MTAVPVPFFLGKKTSQSANSGALQVETLCGGSGADHGGPLGGSGGRFKLGFLGL